MSTITHRRHHTRTALAAGLLALAAVPANADLIAYEGFKYNPAETLAAKTGGKGWGLNWSIDGSNSVQGVVRAGSLNGNQSIATAGHGATLGNGSIYARALSTTLGTTGSTTTRWVSLLFLAKNATGNESRIGFYSGMNDGKKDPEVIPGENTDGNTTTTSSGNGVAQVINLGRSNADTADTICLYPTNASTTFSSSGISTPRGTVAAFLLLRFDLNGSASPDTVSLWVNPVIKSGEAALGAAQATWTTSDLDPINGFRLQAGSTGAYSADEMRIGTTFADVTPVAPVAASQSVTWLSQTTSDVTLAWDSFGDGQNFTVLTSPDMTPGSWTPASSPITDGVLTTTVSKPSDTRSFFRVTSP